MARTTAPSNTGTDPGQGEPAVETDRGGAAPYVPQDLDEGLKKELFLPVHGLVRLSQRELRIIDHPAFQRLCGIHQLGQALLVYRGARHARGEHAIGTVAAATLMAHALKRNGRDQVPELSRNWQLGNALNRQELAFLRLGALLHDIGHLPIGHTLEDELGLLAPHDEKRRMDTVFGLRRWQGRNYDSLRMRVDALYRRDAEEVGLYQTDNQTGERRLLLATDIVFSLVSKDADLVVLDRRPLGEDPATDFRLGVLRDLIGNTLCADLVDYLHRDWWHIGKVRTLDLRLLDYLEIQTRKPSMDQPREHLLVVNLGDRDKPRPDAVTAIVDLLESRYQLAEIVLFHRAKLAAAAMLERVIAEYEDSFVSVPLDPGEALLDADPATGQAAGWTALEILERHLLDCTDDEAYLTLARLVEKRAGNVRLSALARRRLMGAADLARRLRVRLLHKEFAVHWNSPSSEWVKERYAAKPGLKGAERRDSMRASARNRLATCRALERDFELPPCSVVMYCPTARMNSKIAEVNVLWNGVSRELHALDRAVAGGHLKSQVDRFEDLWRVAFSIDRRQLERLERQGRLGRLKEDIHIGALSPRSESDSSALRRLAIAEYPEQDVLSSEAHAARMTAQSSPLQPLAFPSENPTLASHLTDEALHARLVAEGDESVGEVESSVRDATPALPMDGLPPLTRAQAALLEVQQEGSDHDARIDQAIALRLLTPRHYTQAHRLIRERQRLSSQGIAANQFPEEIPMSVVQDVIEELVPELLKHEERRATRGPRPRDT